MTTLTQLPIERREKISQMSGRKKYICAKEEFQALHQILRLFVLFLCIQFFLLTDNKYS